MPRDAHTIGSMSLIAFREERIPRGHHDERCAATRIASVMIFASLFAVAVFLFSHPTVADAATLQSTQRQKPAAAGPEVSGQEKQSLDRAMTALQRNDLKEAEREARAAVASAPRSSVAHNVLGVVLDRSGRRDHAYAEFNEALKIDPSYLSARNNLGRLLAESGKVNEAIAQFEIVLKADPSHVQAHFNLGEIYAEAGEYSKSADHLAAARVSNPEDPQLALAFVKVGYRANRNAEADAAADAFERVVNNDAQALFTLATILAQNKQYERAARLFAIVNKAAPRTYEVLYNLGLSLYNLDKNEEAGQYRAEAADINPAPPETHFRLGLIASARSDTANAVEEFKHAVERDPKNARYHHLLGREYFRAGFWDGAIEEFSKAIDIDPKNTIYLLARADANYRKGEWIASAADFDHAAAMDPKIENIEYWQAHAHRAAGDFDLARQYLEKFVSAHPDNAEALASLGYVAIEQGRLEDAEAPLKKALAVDSKNVPAMYDYARLALKRRDYS